MGRPAHDLIKYGRTDAPMNQISPAAQMPRNRQLRNNPFSVGMEFHMEPGGIAKSATKTRPLISERQLGKSIRSFLHFTSNPSSLTGIKKCLLLHQYSWHCFSRLF
jgi:hypothetical protein